MVIMIIMMIIMIMMIVMIMRDDHGDFYDHGNNIPDRGGLD